MEEQTVLVAALMAGIVATTVTVLIEKYGGVVGGILGTIPTTIIPASIGMASEGGNDALIIWAIVGLFTIDIIDRAIDKNYSPEEISIVGLVLVATLGIVMCWNLKPAPKGKNSVSKKILAARGIVAAMAIGIAVLISSLGMPLLAGLASVFPAIFLTSMIALWLAQGPSVPLGAAGPMMMGGASVAMYSIIAMWSLIEYGLFIGSIIAWVGSIVVWSIPSFVFVSWRAKVTMSNENY